MGNFMKIVGTVVGLFLILLGGVDGGATSVAGIAMIVAVWGLDLKK
jgi:hypothetical protein